MCCLSQFIFQVKWVVFFHFQAQRLGHAFKELMDKYGEGELQMKEMADELMMDTTKDDEGLLPHIYPPETESHLSSIFIDTERPLVSPYILCFTQHKRKWIFGDRECAGTLWHQKHFFIVCEIKWGSVLLWKASWEGLVERADCGLSDWEVDGRQLPH